MVDITKVDTGVYTIVGKVNTQSLTVTAKDMRDIYNWCLFHMRELEAELKEQQEYENTIEDTLKHRQHQYGRGE